MLNNYEAKCTQSRQKLNTTEHRITVSTQPIISDTRGWLHWKKNENLSKNRDGLKADVHKSYMGGLLNVAHAST